MALYEQVDARLDVDAPKPDLVVYLQAPVDVLLERIARRGIGYEQHIERAYLERLNEAYARFFHEYDTRAAAHRERGAASTPVNNQADYDELVAADPAHEEAAAMYYNPLRAQSDIL